MPSQPEVTPTSTARHLTDLPVAHPGVPDLRSATRFLWWIIRGQPWPVAWGIAFGIVWTALQGAVPLVVGASIQSVVDDDAGAAVRWGLLIVLLGVATAASGVMRHRMAATVWIVSAARVQQLVARQISILGGKLRREIATGEVVAVSANDVERIGSAMEVLLRFAGAIVTFIGLAIVLVVISPLLGVIVLVGMPVLVLGIAPLVRPLERREQAQRERYGKAAELAADTVSGLRVLRGVGGESHFVDRFRQRSQEVRVAAVRTARIRAILDALQVALPGIFVVTVTVLGARLALDGTIDVGALVAFYGITAFLVMPLRTTTEALDRFTRAYIATRRVLDVLRRERPDPGADQPLPPGPPWVLADAESGVTLTPDTLTAIVCTDTRTGSALADRLGRHESAAQVTLNGIPIGDLDRALVRATVLVQHPDPEILSGTLAALLDVPRSGRIDPAQAIRDASADDILDGLGLTLEDPPEAWTVELPERGRTLSGGQRQRLSLARSLVADPPVLILDEPTSAVDAHTEATIAAHLRQARAGRTTAVFTTSPLVLDAADRVIFAPDGIVTATGTHAELVRTDPHYRSIVARVVEEVS